MTTTGPNCQKNVKNHHAALLRDLVQDGRRKNDLRPFTLEEIAIKTGISKRALKAYRDGVNLPFQPGFLELVRVLPMRYVNGILALAGVGHAVPLMGGDQQSVCPHNAQYKMACVMQNLSAAMLDGRLDHIEKAELIPQFEGLINDLNLFVQGLRGACDVKPGGGTSTTKGSAQG